MSNRKTLLVGVGGVGSKIVSRVYKEVPEEMRKNFVVHAFDTDVIDLQKLGFTRENYTQTSTDMTIEQYLAKDNMREKVKSWFITDHPAILKKSFASGAGQIRAISRLAYMASIGEGKLQSLDKKLSGMLKNEGNIDVEEIRIMIVSSLVGGTGAGIFLQTALYLKDYFESLGKNVMIRGTFLLPDIFIKTGIITNQQTKNILANGYACLKELNAIIGTTSSSNTKSKSTIELEYKPDMKDRAVNKTPYEFAFLYDYENTEGNHLGSYEQYIHQISKIVHLQLSTEIAGRADSIEVNNIIHTVSEDGMARYASAGVSTVEYPYQDILKYCGLKLANEKIGNRWLKLDKIFENMQEKQQMDIRNGIHQEPMKKHEKLNELFDAEVKNNDQFFKALNRTLHIIGKDNELGKKKVDLFFENVNNLVNSRIEDSKEYKEFSDYKAPNSENMGPKGNLRDEVTEFEGRLSKYKKIIDNTVEDKKNILINAVAPTFIIEENESYKYDYQLGYWIIGREGEELNPLISRYFLNEIKGKLSDEMKSLNDDIEDLSNSIERYRKDFADTSNGGKSAGERVEEVSGKKGFLGFGENKEVKAFREEYEEKSKKQFSKLEEFRNKKILQGIYEELLKIVDELLENDIEGFFRSLNEIITEFTKEALLIAKEHEDKSDVSKIYVLSSAEAKEKLFDEVVKKVDVDNAINGMYKDVFREQYSRFIKRKKGENMRDLPNLKELYKDTIIQNYIDRIDNNGILDKDILKAIKEEYDLKSATNEYSNNEKSYINEILLSATSRAKPLAMKKGANETSIWALNSEIVGKLTDSEKELFEDRSEILECDFSKYEIVKYTSTSGLKAQDFDKFSSKGSNNSYFKGYMEVIDKLKSKESTTITPHLDKNWHLAAYMPDLNAEQAEFDKVSTNRAYVYGLIYEYMKISKGDDGTSWSFIPASGMTRKIKKQGQDVKGRYKDLYDAMEFNPVLVDEVVERVREQSEIDIDKHNADLIEHRFIDLAIGKTNFIDVLIKIRDEAGNRDIEAADKIIEELFPAFVNEVIEYVADFYGPSRKNTAKTKASYFLAAVLNNSKEYGSADKELEYIQRYPEIIGVKVDELLKDSDISWRKIKDINSSELIEKLRD